VTGYDREVQRLHFAELLESAQDELVETIRQRERFDYKIRILQEDIAHLAPLAGVKVEDPIVTLGLTDAIRYVFGKEKRPIGPTEVKDALIHNGYDVSEYSNVMASIHTIIKRLLKKNEIGLSVPKWGENPKDRKYVWCGGVPPPPPLPLSLLERAKGKE
jgi:hypothetical protein